MIKLSNILKEVMEKEEQYNDSTESTYDKVIKDALKVDQIPLVQGKYKLGQSRTVDSSDQNIFKKLYPITPPKSDKDKSLFSLLMICGSITIISSCVCLEFSSYLNKYPRRGNNKERI